MPYSRIFILLLGLTSFADAASEKHFTEEAVDANDISLVKKSFRSHEEDAKLRDRPRRFPDGAYGYSFDVSVKLRKYSDDPAIQRELELKAKLCVSDKVAVVIAKGAKPFLNGARSMVFTKYRLEVINSIASNNDGPNGSHITALLAGGEVAEGAEKFRVRNLGSPELQPDESYVVFLNALERGKAFNIMEAIPVRAKRVYPNKGAWGGLSSGMPVDDVISEVQKVRAAHCPNLQTER